MPPVDIRPLTSLRIFAAFWVVLFHYWPKLDISFVPNFVAKGYLGVELFFVLSGFILSHVYLEASGKGYLNYRSFMIARFARVYPLHLATLIGVGALAIGAGMAGFQIDKAILSWESLPANLLMIHAWGFAPEAGWNHPSWSISAEWFAYLAFPLFAAVAWPLRHRPYVAIAGAIVLLTVTYFVFERLMGFTLTLATIQWGALRIVPPFALGCALYLAYQKGAFSTLMSSLLGVAVAGLVIVFASSYLMPDALIVVAGGLLILALAGLGRFPGGVMSSAPLVWLGEVSYAVYMVCVPWKLLYFNAMTKFLKLPGETLPLIWWIPGLLMVIPIAAVGHHLIEKPCRFAIRQWSD